MKKEYYACVYGGASEKIADSHKKEIETLGELIAKHGLSLVYGAGGQGCMGAVARGVKKENGFVFGVVPHFMQDFEGLFECDKKVWVETMSERKNIMEEYADIYLITPGGIGTMDEFFQVLTLKYLKRICTPIVVLNLDGFYDSLLALIDDLIRQGALIEGVYELFDVVTKVDDPKLLGYFEEIVKE